jgi:hypothetical protein
MKLKGRMRHRMGGERSKQQTWADSLCILCRLGAIWLLNLTKSRENLNSMFLIYNFNELFIFEILNRNSNSTKIVKNQICNSLDNHVTHSSHVVFTTRNESINN